VIELPSRCDDYVLVHRLAIGGMAEIYLAVEDGPGRRFCVIKRVRGDYADIPDFEEFFLTEGRVSLLCHHPNLPSTHRLGVVGGRAYLAMEYVHGHGVQALQRAVAGRGVPVTIAAAIAIGLGTARALEHLHGLNDVDGTPLRVVHRDVSPHNLMISSAGVVKLIDLGVARASLQTHRTQVGVVKGKYAYLAPEQAHRERRVDQRADLFALGAVIHELLVGRPLFHGLSELDTVDRVRGMPIPEPSMLRREVPDVVSEVVMTALERDPERRWPSAAALADALEDAAARAGVWPSPTDLAVESVALCGPSPRPVLAGGGLRWEKGPQTWAGGSEPAARIPRLLDAPDAVPRAVLRESSRTVVPRTSAGLEAALLAEAPTASPEPVIAIEEDETTCPVDDPSAPALGRPMARDPALAYFLQIGAVPRPRTDGDADSDGVPTR
jgi:eukaryotic-like serine/threonine-protein kinase